MNWQPIETAPKDGTRVLIFDRFYGEGVARFCREKSAPEWFLGEWRTDFVCAEDGVYTLDDATHWMPLPEPPQ